MTRHRKPRFEVGQMVVLLRQVLAQGDTEHRWLPKGTRVLIHQYSENAHRYYVGSEDYRAWCDEDILEAPLLALAEGL